MYRYCRFQNIFRIVFCEPREEMAPLGFFSKVIVERDSLYFLSFQVRLFHAGFEFGGISGANKPFRNGAPVIKEDFHI